jgi:hypothetical protein
MLGVGLWYRDPAYHTSSCCIDLGATQKSHKQQQLLQSMPVGIVMWHVLLPWACPLCT